MNKRIVLVLGAVLLIAGSLAMACSSDTDDLEDRIAAIEQQLGSSNGGPDIAALQEQIEVANMVATLNLLDGVGFHHLNETIDADGVAPDGTVGTIRSALRAVAATSWPSDLEAGAGDFQGHLSGFLTALSEDGDVVATSLMAHDGYHDFTDTAWSYLGDRADLDIASDADDHANHEEGMDEGMEDEEGMDDEMSHDDEMEDDMEHMEEPTP